MSDHSPIIWRFVDGKAGHENQSLALVKNLQHFAPFEFVDVSATGPNPAKPGSGSTRPALTVGAGHRTHLPLLRASRRHDCPSVVIMNPTIPRAFFDLCFIPEHDLSGPPADNVVATRGMMNLVPAEVPPKSNRGLILIGGPSKHHDWDPSPLLQSISKIVSARSGLEWHLTDSRRTPEGFLKDLEPLDLTLHPNQQTPPGWLPAELLSAREVWVTEDSMSMIYEALTAQARVGLLPMPRKSDRSRIVQGIQQLVADGWTRFLGDDAMLELPEPPEVLHEASRCAREVLNRFFPALA